MLDSECVMHYLSHTKRSNTTLHNGAMQLWGMFMFLIMKRCWYTHYRPSNAKELYNLQHASAWNTVEWIFGILKHCFRILTIPPESSMAIQAHIPLALCTIHNFIWIHDDIPRMWQRSVEMEIYISVYPMWFWGVQFKSSGMVSWCSIKECEVVRDGGLVQCNKAKCVRSMR